MSKLFTATAVMQAVEAGRVDLDDPITTYLPDFTVHSAFETHPERRITLRMLLGHTAGFTHEAPVGNSNELDPRSFEDHVRSISDTWLRFPVGSGFAHSNLGIDLAGYILERVEHRPFADLVHDSLLGPLGMDRSTFDRPRIRADDNRAIPHVDYYEDPPMMALGRHGRGRAHSPAGPRQRGAGRPGAGSGRLRLPGLARGPAGRAPVAAPAAGPGRAGRLDGRARRRGLGGAVVDQLGPDPVRRAECRGGGS
jgi:CubicO group peptidase (beta-lactamase class C family)